ncbi:MAG: hypothetical protein ABEJ55_01640 [Halanaeroarchaeum sp.]
MDVTKTVVDREHEWLLNRGDRMVALANQVREDLAAAFETDVEPVTAAQYESVVDEVFAAPDRAVNVAALTSLLRTLDVAGDYPGFIIDEYLGRELAAMIAGDQPLRLLAEATFHYADVHVHVDGPAGLDDLDAAVAAGVQTRLPGWEWQRSGPFERGE